MKIANHASISDDPIKQSNGEKIMRTPFLLWRYDPIHSQELFKVSYSVINSHKYTAF